MIARLPMGVFGFSTSLVMLPFWSSWAIPKVEGSSTSFSIISASRFSFWNLLTKVFMPWPITLSPKHITKESSARNGWAVLTACANPKGSCGM